MADVTVLTTSFGDIVPEVWSTFVMEALHKHVVLAGLVWRQFEKDLEKGDVVHVPTTGEITATDITVSASGGGTAAALGTISFSAPDESVTDVPADTWTYAACLIEDTVDAQAIVDAVEHYSKELARAIAEKLDTNIGSKMDSGFTQTVGTDNIAPTDPNLRRAVQYIDDAKAPTDERYLVISPATKSDFLGNELYRSSLYNALGRLEAGKGRGFLGNLYGCDIYESHNLPAGTAGKKNLMFQRRSTALVMQEEPEITIREPHDKFAKAVRARILYGIKVMRANGVDGAEVWGR